MPPSPRQMPLLLIRLWSRLSRLPLGLGFSTVPTTRTFQGWGPSGCQCNAKSAPGAC